jgi:hypothetical protein
VVGAAHSSDILSKNDDEIYRGLSYAVNEHNVMLSPFIGLTASLVVILHFYVG